MKAKKLRNKNKSKQNKSYFDTIIHEDINYYDQDNLYPPKCQKLKIKNKNQSLYLEALNNPIVKIIIAVGPAGTGKTMIGCTKGIEYFCEYEYEKMIITRPVVSNDEEIGFLPGDLESKMDPWMKPIKDVFQQKIHKKELDNLIKDEVIEISPLAFMRGRTFHQSFIFADEMQNSTISQMKMLLTRIGDRSKLVITGDLLQNDLKNQKNGLQDLLERLSNYNGKSIQVVHFNNSDIERSEVVKEVLELY